MPWSGHVHTDAVLSNFAIQYRQDTGIFIGDKVLPRVKVNKEADTYTVYRAKDRFHLPNTKRSDGTPAKELDWILDTAGTYSCEEYALKDKATDRAMKNADKPINVRQDTQVFLQDHIMLDRESRVATAVFNATTFASYTAALDTADRWDNYTGSGSDPIADIETGKDSVQGNSMRAANTVIMGYDVYRYVRHHPVILDRLKGGATPDKPGIVGPQELARIFDVDQVLVGRARYNSANIGQTASYAYLWGKSVMICYINPQPMAIKNVTLGLSPMARDFQTKRWRDEEIAGEWIETGEIIDEIITCASCGYYFTTVVS